MLMILPRRPHVSTLGRRIVQQYDLELLVRLIRPSLDRRQRAATHPLASRKVLTLLLGLLATLLLLGIRDHRNLHPIHPNVHPADGLPIGAGGGLAVAGRKVQLQLLLLLGFAQPPAFLLHQLTQLFRADRQTRRPLEILRRPPETGRIDPQPTGQFPHPQRDHPVCLIDQTVQGGITAIGGIEIASARQVGPAQSRQPAGLAATFIALGPTPGVLRRGKKTTRSSRSASATPSRTGVSGTLA